VLKTEKSQFLDIQQYVLVQLAMAKDYLTKNAFGRSFTSKQSGTRRKVIAALLLSVWIPLMSFTKDKKSYCKLSQKEDTTRTAEQKSILIAEPTIHPSHTIQTIRTAK
jgi:hypothetical protein